MGGWVGAQPTLVIAECNIHVLLLLAGHERVNSSLEMQIGIQRAAAKSTWGMAPGEAKHGTSCYRVPHNWHFIAFIAQRMWLLSVLFFFLLVFTSQSIE